MELNTSNTYGAVMQGIKKREKKWIITFHHLLKENGKSKLRILGMKI